MNDFLALAALTFISYLNLTFNFRAIAHKKYWWAIGTDILASAISFASVKIIDASSTPGAFGMMLGGALASALGIYLTRRWDEPEL